MNWHYDEKVFSLLTRLTDDPFGYRFGEHFNNLHFNIHIHSKIWQSASKVCYLHLKSVNLPLQKTRLLFTNKRRESFHFKSIHLHILLKILIALLVLLFVTLQNLLLRLIK